MTKSNIFNDINNLFMSDVVLPAFLFVADILVFTDNCICSNYDL